MPLDKDQIRALLLAGTSSIKPNAAALRGAGPIRYSEKELTCVHSGYYNDKGEHIKGHGCKSPTHYKFREIPTCVAHILIKVNMELEAVNSE